MRTCPPTARSRRCGLARTQLLDAAYAAGIRYFDAARSYGRAEEFLGEWLSAHPDIHDVAVGSKWGYTYTADWRDRRAGARGQGPQRRRVQPADRRDPVPAGRSAEPLPDPLGHPRQPGPDRSGPAPQAAPRLAAQGVRIGLSTSGPQQAEAIRAAMRITIGGSRLFECVQATYNLLETSVGPALAEAHEAGLDGHRQGRAGQRPADRRPSGGAGAGRLGAVRGREVGVGRRRCRRARGDRGPALGRHRAVGRGHRGSAGEQLWPRRSHLGARSARPTRRAGDAAGGVLDSTVPDGLALGAPP